MDLENNSFISPTSTVDLASKRNINASKHNTYDVKEIFFNAGGDINIDQAQFINGKVITHAGGSITAKNIYIVSGADITAIGNVNVQNMQIATKGNVKVMSE